MKRTLLHYVILGLTLCGAYSFLLAHDELFTQESNGVKTGDFADRFSQTASVPAYQLRTYFFAGEAGQTRVHVRFGIVNDVLQFTQEENGHYRAAYEVNLIVVDREQNMAGSRIWKRELEETEFARTNDRQRCNEERTDFLLAPGEYELRVEISDLHTQRRLRRNYPLALPNFNETRLQLSTLAFGKMAPHDSLQYDLLAVFTEADSQQGVFYEISGALPGDTLEAHYLITDWKDEKLDEWRATIIADSGRVRQFEALHARLKYQGLHHLRVTVSTRGQTIFAEAEYRVQFRAPATQNFMEFLREYPGLVYLPLRYISTKKEFKRMMEIPEAQRTSAVAEFWQRRDPSPGTEANELREEFYQRVAFAQNRFATHGIGKAGWETDRGRIYIIHGPPQEVHHQMGELDPMPYEIWFYPEQEKRFVFMDKKGSGEYELVHR